MRKIPVYSSTKVYFALVDDEDYIYLSQFNWVPLIGKTGIVYAKRNVRHTTILMHREILDLKDHDGIGVDHKDGNGLNNQRYNLRRTSQSQNNANSYPSHGTSIYKGVSWNKEKRKWQVRIVKNKERFNLGYFSIEEEAAIVYNKKAIELFGEFAALNILDRGESYFNTS